MPDEVQGNRLKGDRHRTGSQPSGDGAPHYACRKCGQQIRITQQLQRVQKCRRNNGNASMAPDPSERLVD